MPRARRLHRRPPAAPADDRGVDVVLPVCARDVKFLPTSLGSIEMQVGVCPVVHVVCDGFHPPDIVAQLARDLAVPCRVYRHRDNVGPYVSAMRVWGRLETNYYAVQDADDFSLPGRLAEAAHELRLHGGGCGIWGGVQQNGYVPAAVPAGAGNRRASSNAAHSYASSGSAWPAVAPLGITLHPTLVCHRAAFERLGGYAAWRSGADCDFATRARLDAGVTVIDSSALCSVRRLREDSLSHGPECEGAGDRAYERWLIAECRDRKTRIASGEPVGGDLSAALRDADLTERIH